MILTINTKGHSDFIDLTNQVAEAVEKSKVKNGLAIIFVPGSTAAITTIEYESGVIEDMKDVLEKIAPEDFPYKHHQKWGDHNGAAHIRSALIGTDFTVPIENGQLQLGDWQQVVLIDFDEKPRIRRVVVKIVSD